MKELIELIPTYILSVILYPNSSVLMEQTEQFLKEIEK